MNTSTAALVPTFPAADSSGLVIQTGHDECQAIFYPAFYQLVMKRSGQEEKVELGYSGSRLLERLLQTPGTVVSREELMEYAWADRVVGQGSLNQQIYTLRQVLGDEKKREIIQTLPRRGYMFNPRFLVPVVLDEPEPEPQPSVSPAAEMLPAMPVPEVAVRSSQPPLRTVMVLLPLVVVLVASLVYQGLTVAGVRSNQVQSGLASIAYIAGDGITLPQLMNETKELSERIAGLAEQPVELVLGKAADFYQLLCARPDGSARWLMVQETQLASLDEATLRRCLP